MAVSLEVLCGVAAVVFAVYYYLISNFNYWKSRGVEGPKPMLLFGNILDICLGRTTMQAYTIELRKTYKDEPMIGIYEGRNPTLIVNDPNLIKDVLIKDFSKFGNRVFVKNKVMEPLNHNLFTMDVDKWQPLRTRLSPVFTSGKLKGTFSLILQCADQLEKYMTTLIEKGEPIEVRDVAARFTTDVIGSCAFGVEMDSLSDANSKFRQIGREIFNTNFITNLKFRFKQYFPEVYDLFGYVAPYNNVTKFIMTLTSETMQYREKNNIVRPDFINVLMELKKRPEKVSADELTDIRLAAQAFIFFAAGFETSSTTISHTLYELAQNHEIQDKLRKEINEHYVKNNGDWKYENIKYMEYLDKVFYETLRKYPPLAVLAREATDDYTFRDTKVSIEKGLKIWIPVHAIQRDPDIYPNPEKFDPERFNEEEKSTRHPMHFLSFGDGPRNCVGARFAIYQTKIGLIKMLQNYKVDVCEKTEIPYELNPYSFILTPKSGLYLKITKV
ncbi:cytochrome P450 6A1-like [Colletes latitarsis]|uniref:cytochrome P450 6A1-like n=1 Tax=Colletes latitarsis TaxID=2605962 RepID=UPI004036B538